LRSSRELPKKFRQDSLLGDGGFGRVYKGFITKDLCEGLEIEEPLRVAVKVMVTIASWAIGSGW
jgi:hypothetical protein